MNYLNESLTHDSLIARISKLTFKSLSSMLKSSVFGKWEYIHMKKGQIIFGNNFFFWKKQFLEIIYFSIFTVWQFQFIFFLVSSEIIQLIHKTNAPVGLFKACVCFFSQMIAFKKLLKKVFISFKKLFSFLRYSVFVFLSSSLFLTLAIALEDDQI